MIFLTRLGKVGDAGVDEGVDEGADEGADAGVDDGVDEGVDVSALRSSDAGDLTCQRN